MNKPTPAQIKKLEKLAKVLDGGDIELLAQLNELDEKLETVASQIPALRQAVDGEHGKDGERGEKGPKGDAGPQGAAGKDGRDGIDGKSGTNGKDGRDGKDGIDGKDGADGFVDDATIAYLEDEIKRVEAAIPEIVQQKETNFGFVIRDVVAGIGVTIDKSNPNRPIVNANISGVSEWGAITGTLADQTDLNTALNNKEPLKGDDNNYVTDAEKVKLSNLSGTNTGDQDLSGKQDVLTGLTASVVELNYTDGVTSAIQTQLDNKLDDTQFSGLSKITVGTSAPVSPATFDLWVDTN